MFGLNKQRTKLLLEIIDLAKDPEVKGYLRKHEKELLSIFNEIKKEKASMPKWIEVLINSMS